MCKITGFWRGWVSTSPVSVTTRRSLARFDAASAGRLRLLYLTASRAHDSAADRKSNVLPCYTMVESVGIRELRQQATAVLRRVMAGEIIDVTEHGRPIARIVPLQRNGLDQLVTDGRATSADGDLLEALDKLELPARTMGRKSPTESLLEQRDEER
jgi:prevent-host-death family protein